MRILALNKSWLPIRFTSKYDALGRFYTNNVEAILIQEKGIMIQCNWEEWLKLTPEDLPDYEFIGACTQLIAVPKVIRYLKYDKIPKAAVRLNKTNIYARDRETCYICGKQISHNQLSVDHIIPQSRGGRSTWENLITCCKPCNYSKGHATLSELGIKPKFLPYIPVLSNIEKIKRQKGINCKEWEYFGI